MLVVVIIAVALLWLTGFSVADEPNNLEIRSKVTEVIDGGVVEWTPKNFAGFYYDIDNDLGAESIQMTITNGKLDEPNGVRYATTSQLDDFDFGGWGWYNCIGFLGEKYFAGYSMDTPYTDGYENYPELYRQSLDRNTLVDEQLLKVLIDDDTEMTVTSGTPLRLHEGYELAIKSIDIDGNKVYLELSKDGAVVDSKVVSPSKDNAVMADKTYYYKRDVGDTKSIVIIAVHFKNAFRGADQNLATVDGIFQVSDTPTDVMADTKYGKMRICSITSDTIVMDNKDDTIILSKNRDISLMGDIRIKTSNQDVVDEDNLLRCYIYKDILNPGIYEIRGTVATVVDGASVEWNPQNFAGFYYDIDHDLGTESITTTLYSNRLEEPNGVVYTTTAQECSFNFDSWGSYRIIGLMGKRYFAGYDDYYTCPEILAEANATNLLNYGDLSEILIDRDEEEVLDLSKARDIQENYSLKISAGTDNKGMLVELLRDGITVDRKAVLMPGTYVYVSKVGDASGLPIIAAHFQEPIFLKGKSYIKMDGLWQVSQNAVEVNVDKKYGKMRIAFVTDDTIAMDNKDNTITLPRNSVIPLIGDISIKTADQDDISLENPMRYYIFKNQEFAPSGGVL